ncbi:glycine betaine ABC transporter substrate-binding protein OsmF [Hansschlegelia plantiphila]|uniref:ABC transporter substrate-binding protein n=1 Tax=Hansschlegelia plantiphila TaxID=374655 RepID=A0A9W6J5B1_9HYPH|nr:glycine betaine ABC transporter substrate-binding protein [Hansschlegelia plantiphila]GLK69674.1 ABC transporter substrate-binding protein [Hansschlegelia plantiphila]
MRSSGRRSSPVAPEAGLRRGALRLLGALAIALAALPSSGAAATVTVSSKSDTEGSLLGAIILIALEHAGIATRDRVALGGTAIVRAAILAGEIDVYPEYTGNAASFFNRAADPLWRDAAKAYSEAKRLDYDANRIVWLTPSPADNTWAIALRKDVADPNRVESLSDFGRWVSAGGAVTLAASLEFIHSPSALPSFEAAYGFHLKSGQLIGLAGGDTAATLAAAAKQISGANAAMVYGTDGGIPFSGLVVLADDRHVQPVYQPAPIIRETALKAEPRIADILRPIFERLDLSTLQRLNGRIQVGGEPASAVAESYLRDNGFLK